ncbi:MAG TPA: glycosyltransferase family 2 protein [Gaiellaceae bacterium]|nr:glycosyltransferase family 2 protein [Gaiellaceae bacterium]
MSADVTAVTVTLDGLPWLERCLESLRGIPTIVVDHGSTDGTLELVRERFPDVRVIEQENLGYGGGLNAGFRASSPRYYLPINSDAWVVGDAVQRMVAFADAHPEVAVVCPRLRNEDGSLQRSVRGFPTLWRVATEYFFLRKLAPRSRTLNAYYAGGFDHDESREIEWAMGPCFLVRREAADAVGLFDESFFMFWEETDWLYRFHRAGWKVWFLPEAEVVHVGGATHGGRMFGENVKALVQFFAKHHGSHQAARARRLLRAALRLRGLVFRGERGRMYREAARSLR